MTIDQMRHYCLAKKGVTEELPFGDSVLVMKVLGKMFALIPLGVEIPRINVKVEPEVGLELRASYESVQPAFHMNKTHWITATADGSIPERELNQWIDTSYNLVISKFTKAKKQELENL
ncbi:MAG: MmcQ/YjbR family DNA-binding protein [Bacteroidetes bacterium]|nr:MmcQ/YjbR family DNA-binding protein [Bacteroidota bacterium]